MTKKSDAITATDPATTERVVALPTPAVPPVVAGFLASEATSGRDSLYYYGFPLSNPLQEGDQVIQYWSKAVLEWSSDDPSSVKRQPVGLLLWSLDHGGSDPQETWTTERRWILGVSVACLLAGAAGLWVVGANRHMSGSFDF